MDYAFVIIILVQIGAAYEWDKCLETSDDTPSATPPGQDQDMPTMASQECFNNINRLNCSFRRSQDSQFAFLTSLILSKAGSVNGSDYTEIASVTVLDADNVKVWNSMGAEVKGHLAQSGNSYIEFTWRAPDSRVWGKYRCQVWGMDKFGHSVMRVLDTRVNPHPENILNILERTQDTLNVTRNKLTDVENTLINTERELNSTRKQLDVVSDKEFKTFMAFNEKSHDLVIVQNELAETKLELKAMKKQCKAPPTDPSTPFNLTKDFVSTSVSSTPISLPEDFSNAIVYNNTRYLLSLATTVSTEAQKARCGELGGKLVEFDSLNEFDHVITFLQDLQLEIYIWVNIGLTDEGDEGVWTYMSSGLPAEVLDWAATEPSFGREDENCAQLFTKDMKMYDFDCEKNLKYHFMCEVEL